MKKLDVLTCFLKSIGEKITCIPENVLNKNTRNTNYGKDDIPYSVLLSIINHYGYSLKFKLVPSEKSSLMPLKEKREIAAVRLNGLAEYIGTFFPRMKDFADAVGFSRTTILHWLQVDNVQLSKLFYVAQCTQANLIFEIAPLSEAPEKVEEPFVSISMRTKRRVSLVDPSCPIKMKK